MKNPESAAVVDFFWGDSGGIWLIVRWAIKVMSSVLLAFAIHQGLAFKLFQPPTSWQGIEGAFQQANDCLSRKGPNEDAVCGLAPGIRICLAGTWVAPALQCPPVLTGRQETGDRWGYGIHKDGVQAAPPRWFFLVKDLISHAQIIASSETLLRDLEKAAFNQPGTSDVALQLCVGTRETAPAEGCQMMARIRTLLTQDGMSVDEEIDRIRIRALFFGFFQFGTLALFIFACIETVGMWVRWVLPEPELYKLDETGASITPESLRKLDLGKLRSFVTSREQSIGDKLFYQALVAGPKAVEDVRDINDPVYRRAVSRVLRNLEMRVRDPGRKNELLEVISQVDNRPSDSKFRGELAQSLRQICETVEDPRIHSELQRLIPDGETPGDSEAQWNASNGWLSTEVISSIESYRQHLVADATGKQEALETLGDSMLKLAFMGTVYGISSALFSARALDTADPTLKLLAKAEMYSGIGVGFGTTLTGILLSIIAGQLRSFLNGAWSEKIGQAYEVVGNFNTVQLLATARGLHLSQTNLFNVSPSIVGAKQRSIDAYVIIGYSVIFVLVVIGGFKVLLGYWPWQMR